MAATAYPLNHPMAVKLWSRRLFVEALKGTWASKFMGTSDNSMIQINSDLKKDAGDRVRCGLRVQLSGAGVSGDNTLEGNEEELTIYHDDIYIDQLRHAVRSAGKMSEQRVRHSVREEARMGLQDWWQDRIDQACAYQLTGYTDVADTRYTGSQATLTPTNLICGGNEGAEGSLSATTTHAISVAEIDKAVAMAKTASPLIRPIRINGGNYYVMFLHPYAVYQLRQQTGTGEWAEIQKAAIQGGQATKNPLFNGSLGMWNNVILHEWTRLPTTVSATGNSNYRRAVFCGAQSAAVAFGKNSGPGTMSWIEDKFDYGNQLGVSAGMIWGVKKTQFNSADFGTIVLSGYAPNPNA